VYNGRVRAVFDESLQITARLEKEPGPPKGEFQTRKEKKTRVEEKNVGREKRDANRPDATVSSSAETARPRPASARKSLAKRGKERGGRSASLREGQDDGARGTKTKIFPYGGVGTLKKFKREKMRVGSGKGEFSEKSKARQQRGKEKDRSSKKPAAVKKER